MFKQIVIVCAALLSFGACGGEKSAEEDIMDRLRIQTECWNSGDVECFMVGYWASDSLMFIGSDGITYGYENALERYRRKYPDEESMGKLNFDIKHINKIAPEAYLVVGGYHLTRTIGDAQGTFTLVWKKINNEWVIIADHTP